ncbi:MAG: hypothetical protein PHO83_03785 [Geobacteraceae bacterium]|nr:hypothetical protein [Geobacteraceae bacterium]
MNKVIEEVFGSCDNCDKIHERVYSNGGKSCFGVVLEPFRACDVVRCCQTFDTGKKYCTDIALDEATEMAAGYALVVNAIVGGSYVRPCEECCQKEDDCFAE